MGLVQANRETRTTPTISSVCSRSLSMLCDPQWSSIVRPCPRWMTRLFPLLVTCALEACAPRSQTTTPIAASAPLAPPTPGPGWVLAAETNIRASWIHLPTRIRSIDVVRVWQMENALDSRGLNADARAVPELSQRLLVDYDCRRRRTRLLGVSTYSAPNAGGATLLPSGYDHLGPWAVVPPGTDTSAALQVACFG